MPVVAHDAVMLAVFNIGGGEVVLSLALVLILIGRKKLPGLSEGLGQGLSEFRKATRDVSDALDNEGGEAGRALGGIYGKAAAQALTPDNHVAELYYPAVFQHHRRPRKWWNRATRLLKRFLRRLCALMHSN
jgi:sec-independent protein translocase protein TatA